MGVAATMSSTATACSRCSWREAGENRSNDKSSKLCSIVKYSLAFCDLRRCSGAPPCSVYVQNKVFETVMRERERETGEMRERVGREGRVKTMRMGR